MMAASVDVVTLSKASSLPVLALHSVSWGDARLPVKTVLRPRLVDDGDVSRRNLLEDIVDALCGFSLVLLRGKP